MQIGRNARRPADASTSSGTAREQVVLVHLRRERRVGVHEERGEAGQQPEVHCGLRLAPFDELRAA